MRNITKPKSVGDKVADAILYCIVYGSMGCGIYVLGGIAWTEFLHRLL